MENKIRKKKSPSQKLRVTIGRKVIQEKNATETFLSTLNALGPDMITAMNDIRIDGLPLVVTSTDNRRQMRKLGERWFVCTHMPTKIKKVFLERIAKRINVKIKVELIHDCDVNGQVSDIPSVISENKRVTMGTLVDYFH